MHAFIITSRLVYCNSLLYNVNSKLIKMLKWVQNSAAQLLTKTPSRDHITPILQELHWLLVKPIINYKILLLTYKALHGKAWLYVADLLHLHTPPHHH
ncbi:hypothetical protein LDENG_00217240 [Lucifuga dentata]|nr:hypothetical protein LDENG_00217240 [Lucifuga dentata]